MLKSIACTDPGFDVKALSDTLTGLEAFETVAAEEVKPSLTFTLDLEGIGVTDQQANRGASLFVVDRHQGRIHG